MAHWAKINDEGIVENIIVTSNDEPDEGEAWIAENLDGVWVKTSYNTKKGKHLLGGQPLRMNFAQVGSVYIPELDAFTNAKMPGEEDFILNNSTLTWVPAPIPEDATYATPYGPEPDFIDGLPQVADGDNFYCWISGPVPGWWLNPNQSYPKPEGEHFWNGFAKEWQAPTLERPEGNYFWNVFTNEWVEIPAPPEAPTE